jgi:putative aldouronate transport system substrate-binding protein
MKLNLKKREKSNLWQSGAMLVVLYFICLLIFFLIFTPNKNEISAENSLGNIKINWKDVSVDTNVVYDYTTILPNSVEGDACQLTFLEEQYNINIDVLGSFSAEEVITKVPLMLAGGDVPDFFSAAGDYLRSFAYHKFISPLPVDMLKEYCPTLVAMISEYAPEGWLECTYNGQIYGVPLGLWYSGILPRTGVWRLDMLETNGIYDIPLTLDDMDNAFQAICYDENGDHTSIYGMTGDIQNHYSTFSEIFGAFGVLPFSWITNSTGEVVWGGIDERSKETLKLLHSWYEKGYIHPDFQIDKWYSQGVSKFYKGKTAYVNYSSSVLNFDSDNKSSLVSMIGYMQPKAKIAAVPPPLGSKGDSGTHVWGAGSLSMVVFGKHLATEPEKIIRILQILESNLVNSQMYEKSKYGELGVHWSWNKDDGGIKFLEPYVSRDARNAEGLINCIPFVANNAFLSPAGTPSYFSKYISSDENAWLVNNCRPEWGRSDVFRTATNVKDADLYMSDLIELQQVAYVEIITGKKTLDYFDEFVTQWYKYGGDIMLKNAQETYEFKEDIVNQFLKK